MPDTHTNIHTNTTTFPLKAVISQIKQELFAVQNAAGDSLGLSLQKVNIVLSVSRTVDASGKVTIGVPALHVEVGGSGSHKTEQLSTLQVELAPPASSMVLNAPDTSGLGLAQMILETREQLAAGMDERPRLEPQHVVMSVKFMLARSGGATGNIKLVVLSIGGGAAASTSDTHTVTLTFARKDAP